MRKDDTTLAAHLRQRAAEREKSCKNHPSMETLLDYTLDELDETAAAELREHLTFCRACADTLVQLHKPLDFEIDMSLDDKPDFLENLPPANQPQPTPAQTTPRTRALSRWGLPMLSTAAALVLGIMLGPILQRETSATVPYRIDLVDVDGGTRGGGIETIPEGYDVILLERYIRDWKKAETFTVVIRTEAGRHITSKKGVPVPPDNRFRVMLDQGDLRPDAYRVLLIGDGDEEKRIAELTFTIDP